MTILFFLGLFKDDIFSLVLIARGWLSAVNVIETATTSENGCIIQFHNLHLRFYIFFLFHIHVNVVTFPPRPFRE